MQCNYSTELSEVNYTESTLIQRLTGKKKYYIQPNDNTTVPLIFNFSSEIGRTIATDFEILCDILNFLKLPRYSNLLGYLLGCILLGFASDKGGRKMIILACMWTTGVMSVFQIVGHDFISFVFFQFFIGLFIGVRLKKKKIKDNCLI